MTTVQRPDLLTGLNVLAEAARAGWLAAPAWLVGGVLRDALLERPIDDADVAVQGDAGAFALEAAASLGSRAARIGGEHPLWRIPLENGHLDVVPLRERIEVDLAARDFTIDALALPLACLPSDGLSRLRASDVLDQHEGLNDLSRRRLRVVGPTSLKDDPVRTLRGVRLACELAFEIEASTERGIREAVSGLPRVAPERGGAELQRIFASPRAARGVRIMDGTGLLDACFPPLADGRGVEQRPFHRFDVFEHQLAAAEWMDVLLSVEAPVDPEAATVWQGLWGEVDWSGTPWGPLRGHLAEHAGPLRLATLLHDIGKPSTRIVEPDGRTRFFGHSARGATIAGEQLRHWRFPGRLVERVELLVEQHLRPGQLAPPGEPPTSRALHRIQRALGDATPDVCWLFLADSLATVGGSALLDRWPAYVGHIRRILSWRPPASASMVGRLVDGHAVMEATGLKPGAEVGRLLAAIHEATAAGEVRTAGEALALAAELRRYGRDPGPEQSGFGS